MKHVKALLIKFVVTLVLLYIILGVMYEMTFGEVFLLSVILGVISYLIGGDMLILPKTNNTVATIADFGIAWIIIYWFADGMTRIDNLFAASLIGAIAVGVCEIFFHRYLSNNILPDDEQHDQNSATRNLKYQTEISEELETNEYEDKEKK
ncbi:integral membrane protein [Gracilibacillus boraciitolerans JCM 21714]|uniref:Integral membrane protein n=1 Tax=Gracilibacillus boraciitolerans JCM 21714 TaxID=1298598 RepID=W4VI21_9BACI|nr:YndM family protein [Gracilibacillus boraciitolerans]GAE92867.1 integral membrane protein [Gracilibacillus boraciitolerans JCM 21714]